MGVPDRAALPQEISPIPTFPHQGERSKFIRAVLNAQILLVLVTIQFSISPLHANPFLPKPGEAPIAARVGTCSITGGFIHLYTALFNESQIASGGPRGARTLKGYSFGARKRK